MTEISEKSAASRPGKILVMDDDQLVCTTAHMMLTRLGYDVVLAVHGEEAVALYHHHLKSDYPVDVSILDLKVIGGMGAPETAKLILELDPAAKLVVASGSAHDPEMVSPTEHGFVTSLAKPFMVGDVGLLLGELLD